MIYRFTIDVNVPDDFAQRADATTEDIRFVTGESARGHLLNYINRQGQHSVKLQVLPDGRVHD